MSSPAPATDGKAGARPVISLSIDGRNVEVPDGTIVIEAARQAGIAIPHYCYHPALGNPGVCRLCMVEVEGAPKLQASCRLPAKAGMVVRTNSAAARRAQSSSLELHLVNHPLDCPVCDQAGECWLQDYYMGFGLYRSAVREDKVHKPKRVDIGPRVMLDSERCILCTRCTRFLDGVTGTGELGIFNRGSRSEIQLTPGKRLDNPYSGNIVDICPVGALTDKDFRFQVRVWYLEKTPSVCTGCARGCSIEVHSNERRTWHADGRRIARLKPRVNPEVNGWWICDEGRYSHRLADDAARLAAASLKDSSTIVKVPAREAAARAASELLALAAERGSEGLAVVLSAGLSNEALWCARELFSDRLRPGFLIVSPGPDQLGEEDAILRRKEKVANLRGARALGFGSRIPECSWDDLKTALAEGRIWGVYAAGRDAASVLGPEGACRMAGLPFTLFQGWRSNRFAEHSRWVLPACHPFEDEASYCNFAGQVQRTRAAVAPAGEARPDWRIFRDMLAAAGRPVPEDGAGAVFDRITREEPEFSGLSWDGLGELGAPLASRSAEPAQAAGAARP